MIVKRLRSPRQDPSAGRFQAPRLALALVTTLALSVVLSSCASHAELDTLKPKGKISREVNNLITPVFVVAGIVLLLIGGATLYMIKRFGVKSYEEGDFPEQVHGNTKLEIGWTIVPALILAVVAVGTVSVLQDQNHYDKKNALSVVVVGQQWWWEYRYYDGGFDPAKDYDPGIDIRVDAVQNHDGKVEKHPVVITPTQLVIPTNREVDLYISSRDVIHSFWIPALNGKRDAVPGRIAPWKIEADGPGVYFGQCTEFCGLSHSRMRMQVVAMDPADYDTWLTQQKVPATAPTAEGQKWLDQQKAITAKSFDPKADPSKLIAAPTASAADRGMVIFRGQCSRCHLAAGIDEDLNNGTANVDGKPQQVSNAAPNLTHFSSRTTYAGGIFNLYNADGTLNQPQLEAWLRNPPKEKDAYAQGNRGMPNLGLSEDQINDLVAFLTGLGQKPTQDIIAKTEVQ